MRVISLPDFHDYRRRQRQLTSVTAWAPCPRTWKLAPGPTRTGACEIVDGDYFRALEVGRAVVGRLLTSGDDLPQAPPVVVISERAWQNVFGGRSDALGALVSLGGTKAEVVGVVPKDFRGLVDGGLTATDLWIPLSLRRLIPPDRFQTSADDRDERWLMVKGRMSTDGSLEAVATEARAIAMQLDQEFPIGVTLRGTSYVSAFEVSRPWVVRRASDVAINESAELLVGRVSPLLNATMFIVLLATCTTVGSMTLARGRERRLELAIRSALGASRQQLTTELFLEALILCVLAGGIGAAIGLLAAREVARSVYELTGGVMQLQPVLTGMVAVTALTATLLALVVAGVVPARRATDDHLAGLLSRADATRVLQGWSGRQWLIGIQVAVSFVLVTATLVSAGVVSRLAILDGGIGLDRLGILSIDFDNENVGRARTEEVVDAWIRGTRLREGVAAAAAATGLPFGPTASPTALRAADGADVIRVAILGVTANAFDVFGLPVLRGRPLSTGDDATSARVVVLSEDAAMRLWGHSDVVGRVVVMSDDIAATVVGVSEATDTGTLGQRDFDGTVYAPLGQLFKPQLTLLARSTTTGGAVLAPMQDVLTAVGPRRTVALASTGANLVGPSAATARAATAIAAVLAAFSGSVALVGLYGALSYAVAVRAKEIGLRLAVGASPQSIGWMILRQGLAPVGIGLAASIPIIGVLIQSPLLPRAARAIDYWSLGLLAIAFGAAAAAACAPMVLRSMRTAPTDVLRSP